MASISIAAVPHPLAAGAFHCNSVQYTKLSPLFKHRNYSGLGTSCGADLLISIPIHQTSSRLIGLGNVKVGHCTRKVFSPLTGLNCDKANLKQCRSKQSWVVFRERHNIVKLREREGQRVYSGRLLKGRVVKSHHKFMLASYMKKIAKFLALLHHNASFFYFCIII